MHTFKSYGYDNYSCHNHKPQIRKHNPHKNHRFLPSKRSKTLPFSTIYMDQIVPVTACITGPARPGTPYALLPLTDRLPRNRFYCVRYIAYS